jgi:hypothetical protein
MVGFRTHNSSIRLKRRSHHTRKNRISIRDKMKHKKKYRKTPYNRPIRSRTSRTARKRVYKSPRTQRGGLYVAPMQQRVLNTNPQRDAYDRMVAASQRQAAMNGGGGEIVVPQHHNASPEMNAATTELNRIHLEAQANRIFDANVGKDNTHDAAALDNFHEDVAELSK